MKTVEFRQSTRTLQFPTLQDVYNVIMSHSARDGLLHIDLKQLTCGWPVNGMSCSPVQGPCQATRGSYKATVDKHFVIASGILQLI
jgi:hypothetical protein